MAARERSGRNLNKEMHDTATLRIEHYYYSLGLIKVSIINST
jgi:hypothetical protein